MEDICILDERMQQLARGAVDIIGSIRFTVASAKSAIPIDGEVNSSYGNEGTLARRA
jgi:hypothetical protein